MALDRVGILRFDTGIEEILRAEEADEAFLPDTDFVFPTEKGVSSHLERVMGLKSFDLRIIEELRPSVSHKEILAPSRYRALVGESLKIIEGMKGISEEVAAKSRELFEEEQQLMSLFMFFNNILLRA